MQIDLIINNGRIYTVDPNRPWAEAVACAQGRIVAVGSTEAVTPLAGPDTRIIDARQRLVLPGFTDAHVHFLQLAIRRRQVKLFGLTDVEAALDRVREAVEQAAPGQWVQGWGWDENLWAVKPTAALLDEVAPDTPVVLYRVDMHTIWVNSAVLQQANITANTPDPPESQIERDAEGRPTGILREWNAIELVQQHMPRLTQDRLYPWLKETIAEAHRLGLTGIHDQRLEREGRRSFQLFQRLQREGRLKLRVHMHIAADFLAEADALGLQPGFGNDRLWIGHVKAFADGTLGSQTALMLAPFEGSEDNCGIAVTPVDELRDLAAEAGKAGYSLSIHAIGDRAVREVIDVMREFPPNIPVGSLPHRIEHVQVIHPDDMPRLQQHAIFASMQPVHLSLDWRTADKYWGPRTRYTYAFQSLREHGVQLAFGSDAPVAPLNPMLGLYAAVARQDEQGQPAQGWQPVERISVADAVRAYTLGPAQLAGRAHRQGSITPGKWADMIILDRNLFEIAPAEIKDAQVEMTIFDGEVVFELAKDGYII